ncbi:MAG: ShET2/EspL2 family type secretion system effector toxin [Solimicrobium sp.]|nr:ShET2/EspL2 family type secretion system effector toxin [Solimicrobium sp.]
MDRIFGVGGGLSYSTSVSSEKGETMENMFYRALDCQRDEDYTTAYSLFLKLTHNNYPKAMCALGLLLLNKGGELNIDVDKASSQALDYLHRAAEQWDLSAMYSLGAIYLNGKAVEKDDAKAFSYFLQAANCGCNKSVDALKKIYFNHGWKGPIYTKEPVLLDRRNPYRLIPNLPPRNLNNQAFFTSSSEYKIACRHFVAKYIEDIWTKANGDGEVNWENYSTEESIATHIPITVNKKYENSRLKANSYHLINNDTLGKHLRRCFEDMQKPTIKEAVKTLLIESVSHAMAIRLCIKTQDKPLYMVNFYDPNITNNVAYCQTDDLSTLDSQTLRQYVTGSPMEAGDEDHYSSYYCKEDLSISLLMEYDSTCVTQGEKKLTTFFNSNSLASIHLFFLLRTDLHLTLTDPDLYQKLEGIGQTSPSQLVTLLFAKSSDGTSGLLLAIQNGYASTVNAYGRLLSKVWPLCQQGQDNDKLIELIAAKRSDGVPALILAMQRGKAATIKEYKVLLQLLPESARGSLIDLFGAKSEKGMPGLYAALQEGYAEVISAYEELLPLLPVSDMEKLPDLLAAKSSGIPGLLIALQNGHGEAVKAYGKLLQLIPVNKRDSVINLLNIKTDGYPGLFLALVNNCSDAVRAYGEILFRFFKDEPETLVNLLAAKDKDGVPGILVALGKDLTEVVKAYEELIQLLLQEQRQALFHLLFDVPELDDLKSSPVISKGYEALVIFKEGVEKLRK